MNLMSGEGNGGFTRSLRATAKAVPEDARRHNRSLMLQSLFSDGPLSRADLARSTHLTPTTTSDLVAGLLEEGLVEELGRREVRGVGKPATLVGIVPDARHIVTLDLSADEDIHGAVVNLIGKVLYRRTVAREQRTGQDAVALAVRLARELMAPPTGPSSASASAAPASSIRHGVVSRRPTSAGTTCRWPASSRLRSTSRSTSPTTPMPPRWPSTRSATRRPTTSCSSRSARASAPGC